MRHDFSVAYGGQRLLICLLLLICVSGCGPSQKVLDEQEKQIQQAYQEAVTNPPNLPPDVLEKRKGRIEMDFGVTPDFKSTESTKAKK